MELECLSAGVLVADHLCAPISHLPRAGELVLTDDLILTIGGCASNAAVDLARLGIKVGVLGCVGEDPFGEFIIDVLKKQGVHTDGIRKLSGVGTSGTLIVNVKGEDRRFIHMQGANNAFTAEQISLDQVLRAKVFYVGGYLLLAGMKQDGLQRLFRDARRGGVKTVLDVVLPGPGEYWSRMEGVLSETDVFHCNHDEAKVITGLDDPVKQAERFFSAGAKSVIVTHGGEGGVMITRDVRVRMGVHSMPYVGATGAGDAFDAGYIAGLLAGEDPLRCLAWGSALGASCVRSVGATESVFTRDEALEFMKKHPLPITRI